MSGLVWESARIRYTHLGWDDDLRCITAILGCEGESWGQGFGCLVLNNPAALQHFIMGCLTVLGGLDWSKLQDQRLEVGRENGAGNILAIKPLRSASPIFAPHQWLAFDSCLYRDIEHYEAKHERAELTASFVARTEPVVLSAHLFLDEWRNWR